MSDGFIPETWVSVEEIISGGKMPVNWSDYPDDWQDIASRIKTNSGWRCESCDKQCRKPDEEFDTHKRTLTVAHINHVKMDCREENLIALCAPCHLKYDAPMKRLRKIALKRLSKLTHEKRKQGEG